MDYILAAYMTPSTRTSTKIASITPHLFQSSTVYVYTTYPQFKIADTIKKKPISILYNLQYSKLDTLRHQRPVSAVGFTFLLWQHMHFFSSLPSLLFKSVTPGTNCTSTPNIDLIYIKYMVPPWLLSTEGMH